MRDTARQGADRIEFANSLRGVAATSVVVAHLVEAFWVGQGLVTFLTGMPGLTFDPPWFARLAGASPVNFASFGVGLFFVISGFVIPFSLARYDARAFLVGRLLRIYPTYWIGFSVTVAAVLVGNLLDGGAAPFNAVQALLHYFPPLRALLYSKPIDGIIWTLEIEMFFYLICAVAARGIGRGRLWVGLIPFGLFAAWAPLYAFVVNTPAGWEKVAGRLEFAGVYLPFLIFMFIGVALNFRQRGLIGRGGAAAWISACVVLFVGAWATKYIPGWRPLLAHAIDPVGYLTALGLFLAAMAGQRYFRAHPAMRFMADVSYPLYVVHGVAGYALLHILVARRVEANAALAITLVAVFGAAWLIHRFVETPTHRFGQRLARAIAARDAARRTGPVSGKA